MQISDVIGVFLSQPYPLPPLTAQYIPSYRIPHQTTHLEMYGVAAAETEADTERTAFRKAEKRYKLYKALNPKSRKKQLIEVSTDLSDVFDFEAILKSFEKSGDIPKGVFRFECPGFHRPVFCFDDRPGFYFIPSPLTIQEQSHWIRESLFTFPQPPNRTNHNAMYGPIHDLFKSVETHKVLVEEEHLDSDLKGEKSPGENLQNSRRYVFTEANNTYRKGDHCKLIPASVLLRKLRWSTLGLQFDWSKRNYDVSLHHNKIPDALCFLAKKNAVPAMPSGEVFQPEGAIVNYFGPSDMLGGHVDDMEKDWSKPIVSISLGCKAIFLLGGKSRDDVPVALFLRSGDIVLMAGQARECFHGIPRIFTDKNNADVSQLLSQFSSDEDVYIRDYIATSRININIRQVN